MFFFLLFFLKLPSYFIDWGVLKFKMFFCQLLIWCFGFKPSLNCWIISPAPVSDVTVVVPSSWLVPITTQPLMDFVSVLHHIWINSLLIVLIKVHFNEILILPPFRMQHLRPALYALKIIYNLYLQYLHGEVLSL